nr:g-type lectin s-receptor-like serine/threonine-protein kinase [Quercus suber]
MLKITGVGTDGGNGIYKQSADECKVECLSDCRCQAYSFQSTDISHTKANTATCWIWSEDVNNIQEESIDGGSDARELYGIDESGTEWTVLESLPTIALASKDFWFLMLLVEALALGLASFS